VRIAQRILIVAYAIAAIVWAIALFRPQIVWGDLGTAMIDVTAFGCTHGILALLFLSSAIMAAVTLVGELTLRRLVIFCLALTSFAAASCYCYLCFYG